MDDVKAGARWIKSHWTEEDVLFYFELDEDGWVVRQVELEGEDRAPRAAAALHEWPDADVDGLESVQSYEAAYGAVADQPVQRWDPEFPHEVVGEDEFNEVWAQARAHLAARRSKQI